MFCDSEAYNKRNFKMAVSSYLKASVCLMILISLSATTRADDTSDCQIGCSGSESETAVAACISKCKEIVANNIQQREVRDKASSENKDGYEDPTDGLRLKRRDDFFGSDWFDHNLPHRK